jgi:hypothetical protein
MLAGKYCLVHGTFATTGCLEAIELDVDGGTERVWRTAPRESGPDSAAGLAMGLHPLGVPVMPEE